MDEEEDEVGQVAFAGEDAFWGGHDVHFFFLLLLGCLVDLSCR